jgi:GT2 family glycosyltransferase
VTDTLLASVVVAVRDDERVRRLLCSLVAQTLPPRDYEVIVVENGSSRFADLDGAAGGVVRYVHAPHPNTAAARNIGLRVARGRYLLLTDSDCVAEPDWIHQLTASLADGIAIVGGRIEKYRPRTWVQRGAITIVDGQRAPSYLPALHLPYVAGANAGFDTAILRSVGGFDETLLSGNDVDVCYKIGLAGHRLAMVGSAVVRHDDRATLAAHMRRFHRYAVYQVLLYGKYKHESGKRFVLDIYPLRRAVAALSRLPRAVRMLAAGDLGPIQAVALQLAEAVAVLSGTLAGAIRFGQPYL